MRLARSLLWASATIAIGASGIVLTSAVADAGSPRASKSTVQAQTAKIPAAKTGQKRPKVTCPSGVAAKVGAVIHCTVVPHRMSLKYPATVTVRSLHGSTANFYVQVGQLGQANQVKFCADNAIVNSALSSATTPTAFLSALQANEQVILEIQSTAPSKIVNAAGTLTEASRQAIQTRSVAIFDSKAVTNAAIAVDKFCGQSTSS
jgi:hypothetical protein